MEFGIVQYDESKSLTIILFSFSFRVPFISSMNGYAYSIDITRRGFMVEKCDIMKLYYWKKIFNRG